MELHSRTDDTPESRRILEGQLRECYGRVVYTHKTQEKCADIMLCRLSRIKLCQMILSAATACDFVSVFFGSGNAGAAVGVLISGLLLFLNAYTKDYDLGKIAQRHKQAANDIWFLREKYLALLTDLAMGEKPLEALQTERDALLEKLHDVYTGAPSTLDSAYAKAQKALQKNEDMTFSDEEIDAFLPKELKRSKTGHQS